MADAPADLMSFVAAVGGDTHLRVEENLGEGFVRLRVSEAERRQAQQDIRCVEDAVVEMLRNARDAGAKHLYVATSREGDLRTVVVLDDGCGIPEHLHDQVFDARVTSKLDSMHLDRWGVHGRGMALFSIRQNAVEAKVMSSDVGLGTCIRVQMDTNTVSERADQSSWPTVGLDNDGAPSVVRGPHNIVRACCEFALEEHDECEVYLGSPAEMVATARRRATRSVSGADLLFVDDLAQLPVLERMAAAADARELAKVSCALGLDISERTAHRIVGGEIRPMRSVYSQLVKRSGVQRKQVDLTKDRRGLKISADDQAEFLRIMERAFSYLGSRYYVTLDADPQMRVSHDKVVVTFHMTEDD